MLSRIGALFGSSNTSGAASATNAPIQAAYDPDRAISRSRTTGFARPGDVDKAIARLPAPAAAKLRRLLDEQAELGAYTQSLAVEQSDLTNQRIDAQGRVERLKATRTGSGGGTQSSYFDLSLARGAVPDGGGIQHHTPQVATNEQLKDAIAQVAEIDRQRKAIEDRLTEARTKRSALANNVLQWLVSIPPDVIIASYEDDVVQGFVTGASEAAPPGLDATVDDVSDIRQQIAELVANIHTVRSAPLPSSEAKARMRAQVAALAASGAPSVLHLVEHGHKIDFPEVHHQAQVLGGAAPAIASHKVPDTQGLLAWLFHDQLVARLDQEIDEAADDDAALSDAQKREREANIREDVLSLERQEVALIEALAAYGAAVRYREDTDPRALLGLSSTLPAPAHR